MSDQVQDAARIPDLGLGLDFKALGLPASELRMRLGPQSS